MQQRKQLKVSLCLEYEDHLKKNCKANFKCTFEWLTNITIDQTGR